MRNIVYENKDKVFHKIYKIFVNTQKGLIEPRRIDIYEDRDIIIFSEYDTEEEAFEALFNESEISEYRQEEFIIMPVYTVRPVY